MRWLALLVLVGCGRIAFDPLSGRDANGAPSDLVPSDTLPAGLIRWYPLDGNMSDVASGVDATCAATECPTPTPGHHGTAFLFDSINDCLSAPEAGQLSLQQYTIALWARQDASQNCSAFAKPFGAGNLNSWQLETNTMAQLVLTMDNGGANSQIPSTIGTITLGQWHHFAATVDGAMRTLYYDGMTVGGSAWASTTYDSSAIVIGCDINGASALHWAGALDDVQLYNRVLSGNEIFTLATN